MKEINNRQDELILSHIYLVEHVVNKVMPRFFMFMDRQDLIGYGQLGLVKAARGYRDDKNTKFSTYAYRRIYGAIIDGLRLFDWLPRAFYKRRAEYNLYGSGVVCLESEIRDFRNTGSFEEIGDVEFVSGVVAKLPERERQIVTLHYYQGEKFNDIAKKLRISKARVSQLHRKSLRMLKDMSYKMN